MLELGLFVSAGFVIAFPIMLCCNAASKDTDLQIQDGHRKVDAMRLEAARSGLVLCMDSYSVGIEKYVHKSIR